MAPPEAAARATVSAQAVEPERLAAALARHDIVPRMENAVEFARSRHVFLAEHRPSRVAVDVSLAWLLREAGLA